MRLRAERAALLGYPHHAAYVIEDQTAKTADAALDMLHRLAPAAVANAKAEAQELVEEIPRSGEDHPLEPWDWAFYAERVRKRRFEVDDAELRPYFELDTVLRDGVFYAATQLYGITFQERHDLPTYHPDVRVFECSTPTAVRWACSWGHYARESKRGGAWMNFYCEPSGLLGKRPVVNNLNITKPPQGERRC